MRLKIVKLSDLGHFDKLYGLFTEDGECLYTHICSGDCFAYGDLYGQRENRQLELQKRFGIVEVSKEIMTLEKAWFILEHGSEEGLQAYLEAISTIKENCVEVTRCKDCKKNDYLYPSGYIHCKEKSEKHPADWFCADGERK